MDLLLPSCSKAQALPPLVNVRVCTARTRAAEENTRLCQLMEGMVVHVTEEQDVPARAGG